LNGLVTEPLLWLTITVAAYAGGDWIYRATGGIALLNPVVVAITAVAGTLLVTDTEYARYFEGSRFLHFLLGPATVALAVPLARQGCLLRRYWRALGLALVAGSVTAVGSALLLGWLLGLPAASLASMLPKSATTPIAMGVAEGVGGVGSLTAVLVIIAGLLGAVLGIPLLRACGIRSPMAQGFALGVAAHGLGTARGFQSGATTGAFAGLGMGLNGILTALLVPLTVWLFAL
jgi:predicted murein hydrolase (TIGR00659 family)